MCNSDDEILCLKYHPLQDQLSKEELLEGLTLEFVNRTNEVGVDINRAINYPHTANLVQFVCGLGPRKGQALIKILKQNNQRLENRTQLVTTCHMGPKVVKILNFYCNFISLIFFLHLFRSLLTVLGLLKLTPIHSETAPSRMLRFLTALESILRPTNGPEKWQLTLSNTMKKKRILLVLLMPFWMIRIASRYTKNIH